MRTSVIVWTLAIIIIILGLAWYVYANTSQGTLAPSSSNYTVTTSPSDTNLPSGDMTPTSNTPIASSTSVDASTSVSTH